MLVDLFTGARLEARQAQEMRQRDQDALWKITTTRLQYQQERKSDRTKAIEVFDKKFVEAALECALIPAGAVPADFRRSAALCRRVRNETSDDFINGRMFTWETHFLAMQVGEFRGLFHPEVEDFFKRRLLVSETNEHAMFWRDHLYGMWSRRLRAPVSFADPRNGEPESPLEKRKLVYFENQKLLYEAEQKKRGLLYWMPAQVALYEGALDWGAEYMSCLAREEKGKSPVQGDGLMLFMIRQTCDWMLNLSHMVNRETDPERAAFAENLMRAADSSRDRMKIHLVGGSDVTHQCG